MKKAVILHGLGGSPQENWFPWLKSQLEARGYEVWVPQLPDADEPSRAKWSKALLGAGWDFQDNLVVGHSAGAVELLHLLQALPQGTTIRTAVFASAFSQVLSTEPDWHQLKGLFDIPFDFPKIQQHAANFIFVHGEDDPWCDPEQAQYLCGQVDGEYISVPGGKHFSAGLDPAYTQFPKLLEILEARQQL